MGKSIMSTQINTLLLENITTQPLIGYTLYSTTQQHKDTILNLNQKYNGGPTPTQQLQDSGSDITGVREVIVLNFP